MSKRAVVLAGGKGSRLRPYTIVLPKPLMPIGEYPVLEVIVRQLASRGFDHITLAVNHQAELIEAFFGGGKKWNIRIDYSREDQPLSTIAPLKAIAGLPENFALLNGDVLTDLPFDAFLDRHTASGAPFTISAYRRTQLVDYGVLETEGGRLAGFREKPRLNYLVSMGVYAVNRSVLDKYVPAGRPYGFDNLMLDMIAAGDWVNVEEYGGYWLDIGRPDDYMEAIDSFSTMKDRLLPAGRAAVNAE
jgi:NDP-sugar pyrophosphorylase family protein